MSSHLSFGDDLAFIVAYHRQIVNLRQLRHVRSFSGSGRLKSYVHRHPEGIILAGVGALFFIEPIPVSSSMIRFDSSGNADISVGYGAESIEKQLAAMEKICAAAAEAAGITSGGSAS